MSQFKISFLMRSFPGVLLLWCVGFLGSLQAQPVAELPSAKDYLVDALQKWAGAEIGVSPAVVKVQADDPRLIVRNCESEYRFSFPFANQNTVSVQCDTPSWRLTLRVQIIEQTDGFVFIQDFPAGTIIGGSDIEQSKVPRDALEQLELSDIVGKVLSIAVRAGQQVRGSLLEGTTTQYETLTEIAAGATITGSMIQGIETRGSIMPLGNRLTLSDIEGAKAVTDLPAGTVLSRADLLIPRRAVFTRSLVGRGNQLSPEFLEERIHYGDLPRDTISSLTGLGRATAIRQLAPGQPLRYSDIRPVPDISKGEIVELTVNRGAVTVTIDVEATERGFVGDQIELRNIESGRLVNAIVTGPGAARRD
ncbi:MAG: flagellar basal body P-ring formation chaperone FlgA [Pseudomonadota bacterium]|nr:flagellar basal body P-ring formation chaperone FlgA [Pseudomonadota bacterium]